MKGEQTMMIQEQLAHAPTPPDTIWEMVQPLIQTALQPSLIFAIVLTIFATHIIKQLCSVLCPHTTCTAAKWRAYSSMFSFITGMMVGSVVFYLGHFGWLAIPITALASGPAWRLAVSLSPPKIASALMTDVDKRFKEDR